MWISALMNILYIGTRELGIIEKNGSLFKGKFYDELINYLDPARNKN